MDRSGRSWKAAGAAALAASLIVGAGPLVTGGPAKRVVVIRAAVRADASGPDRAINLKRAVDRLNPKLTDVAIQLQIEEPPTPTWADETARLMRAFAAGEGPDIYTIAHPFLGQFAKAGHALILDTLIKQYPDTYNDFYPSLWNSVRFRGSIYAIPQDTEARMVYFRLDRLRQFGWSDAQIRALPERVRRGEFTLRDMAELAQQVKDRGIVEWGFMHRPVRGPDYYQLIMAFGGRLQDPRSGKLVLSKSATLEFLKFLHDLVYRYRVTPASMTNMTWRSILGGFAAEGKLLFWLGGIWQSGEFIKDYGVPAGEFFTRIDWMLIPPGTKGGRPVTLSHPIIYVVSARSREKELAFRIVTEASAADLNAIHNVNSVHLAIRKAVVDIPEYKNNPWLSRATALLEYTTFLPLHEDFGKYDQIIYEAIQAVEFNRLSPEAALQFVETQLRSQLGNQLIVQD
ncbi:MAG: extracellular solute-binding protein [Armatimonadota bacterium]|nr:extracellular solute-binding protein [Armatimonadota bacterium]MDR7548774.1 extracellular solute-binding protein [Armatimonadota bacterium]